MENLTITIREIAEDEIDLVHAALSPDTLIRIHHLRYAVQKQSQGVYLIAWHENQPVGHLLLRFKGPFTDQTKQYPYPKPYLEGIETKKEYRRRGIATQMMLHAETICRERGDTGVGLTVGVDDNPDARRLYEALGYHDWGQGQFTIRWEYKNTNGESGIATELCIYMLKDLLMQT